MLIVFLSISVSTSCEADGFTTTAPLPPRED
jgi:hypothetical protein